MPSLIETVGAGSSSVIVVVTVLDEPTVIVSPVVDDGLDDLPAVFFGVRAEGADPELFLMIAKNKEDAVAAIGVMKKVVDSMQLWLKSQYTTESVWQVHSLASVIEMVGKLEYCRTVKKASEELVNEIARHLQVNSVAVAFRRRGQMVVHAISGVHKLDRGSTTLQNYTQVVRESVMRERQGVFPAVEHENDHLLIAHKQLAAFVQTKAVFSQPLVNSDGELVGSLVATGDSGLQGERMSRFMDTISPPISDTIGVVRRAQRGWLTRTFSYIASKLTLFTKLMIPFGIFGLCMLMMAPVTYKVRCNCTTEPISRRYAVAPFDGLIVSGFVEPGDLVSRGQVLAEIDGRTIRWELTGVTAEKMSSLRQREIELVDENIPKLFLAELENDRLTAEEEILKFKKDNLQIKSPIDGVVLSGSLERSEASSVTTGQVLFEVGPIDSVKIQIEIPANEVAQVRPGHQATIWVEGNEEFPLEAEIETIHPRSTTRDGKNVFVAELKFENQDDRLRPGMEGTVRIDCEKRSLGWALFHKPMNYVRSNLVWW